MVEREIKAKMDLDADGVVKEVPVVTGAIGEIDRSVEELDKDLGGLDRKVQETGRDMVKTAAETGLLNVELAKARDRYSELRLELDKTGASPGLMKQIRQARSELVQLERVAKEFENEAKGDKGGFLSNIFSGGLFGKTISNEAIKDLTSQGIEAGEIFSGTFRQVVSKGAGALAPVLVPIGVAVGIELGAAVAGGLTAGLGGAGLAFGIIGALQNPKVKAAATDLGASLKTALTTATQSFVDPLTGAIRAFDIFIQTQAPEFAKIFQPLSGVLGNLERGVEDFITAVLPGLRDGVQRAAPLIQELSSLLPRVGKAIGDFIEKISSSQAGNRAALRFIVDVIDMIIEGLGNLLQAASHAFAGMIRVIKPVADILDDIVSTFAKLPLWAFPLAAGFRPAAAAIHSARKEVDDINGALDETPQAIDQTSLAADNGSHSLKSMADIMAEIAEQTKKVNEGFDTLFGRQMDIDTATLKYNEDLSKLKDNLDKAGATLDIQSEAGQKNIKTIEAMISDIKDLRDAQIANGMSTDEANAKYDAQLKQLEANLIQMGFNKQAVQALIDKYRAIPSQVNTLVNVLGLDPAEAKLQSVTTKLNALQDRIVTTYVVVNTVTGETSSITKSGPKFKAAGGPIYAGQDYIVGENGPEFFRPNVNGYIFPNSYYEGQRHAYTSSMSGGGSGQITITVVGGDPVMRTLIRGLKAEIRGTYGGDVTVALGTR